MIKNDHVLMVQRTEEECPEAHLKWEFPGGKVDFGETPEQSIAREVLEETGVTVKVIKLLPYVSTSYWEYEWGTQQTLCFVYLCEFVRETPPKVKDHHVEKIEWIPLTDVKNLACLPGTHEILNLLK